MYNLVAFLFSNIIVLSIHSPEDYLIRNLPLYNDSNGNILFKQYAGYIHLNDTDQTALFFWFVESQQSPSTDPICLWLNGGPGASSIGYGFFTEHGPFRLSKNATTLNPYQYSWNKISNILYLDTPSGTGLSYSNNSNGYNCSDNKTTIINYMFLQKFFQIFTNFSNHNLYLSGESYAGHFIPQLANYILQHYSTNSWTKNLKGFLIGNPAIDGDDYKYPNLYGYFTFLYQHGLLPQTAWIENNKKCNWNKFISDCSVNGTNPSHECVEINQQTVDKYIGKTPYWDAHNIYAPLCHNNSNDYNIYKNDYDPCIDTYTPIYMNRYDVLKSIHAYDEYILLNRTWPDLPVNWYYLLGTADIQNLFTNEFFVNVHSKYWNITVVNGDADSAVPSIASLRWIECLNRKVIHDWDNWYMDNDVAGSIKFYEGIIYQTVKYCGHMIPT
eukprot:42217_1